MGIRQILRVKFLLLITPLLIASGCAYKPMAIYDGDVYIGAFLNGENNDPGCDYSYIQGGGIKLGLLNFGVGYFSNKKMEVEKSIAKHCKSEIAEVFMTDDELTEESITFE